MTQKTWFQDDEAQDEGAASAPRRKAPIDPAALEAATAFVASLASPEAGALFAALVGLYTDRPQEDAHEAGLVAFLSGFASDADAAAEQIRRADDAFVDAFAAKLVLEVPDAGAGARLRLADVPAGVVDDPDLGRIRPIDGRPHIVLEESSKTWVRVVAAAVRSGRGHHLALRAEARDQRCLDDFACALAEAQVDVFAISADRSVVLSILRCELHGAPGGAVVVAGGEALVADTYGLHDDGHDDDAPPVAEPEMALRVGARTLLPVLNLLRNTYVWRVPPRGSLPRELTPILGGIIGAVRADRAWSVSRLLDARPVLGAEGARRLLTAVGDLRDAEAPAALAEAAATTPGFERPDEACRFVADSFTDGSRGAPSAPSVEVLGSTTFDERLFACDADGLALLHRGEALSRGCRILAAGPPSGGKTTYAYALASAIADASGRTIVRVEPADLLARSWGATERLLAALWRRARSEHLVLLADELDSLCTRRETDAPASGNGYLIRTLTNDWLRQLDAHPDVPMVATTNDEGACDRAVLRRMTMVVAVGDTLSPEQERLAWKLILQAEPPEDWRPCGAAVGDFAAAVARCRLLGSAEPAAMEEAVAAARRARLGPDAARPARPRRRPLH